MNTGTLNFYFRSALMTLLMTMFCRPADGCTNILVSKGASRDGSVMISYAADSHQLYGELYYHPAASWKPGTLLDINEWDTGRFLGRIPQISSTYQTVGNMNQWGVMITETTFGGRPELPDSTASIDYATLIYVTLQRARTAREAIDIISDFVNEYGYFSGGESLSIGDDNEAWILEIVGKGVKLDGNGKNLRRGAVWAAARVPEGYICAHANQSRIHHIDFADTENWRYAPDVVSFAREMGYFEGSDADFSFCDAYNPVDFGGMRGCEARVWSAFRILGGGRIGSRAADDYLDFAMGFNASNKMPLFIKPAGKVSLKDVADVMRDHYEGTPMDMTTDAGAGGHHTPYRWRPMYFESDGHTYLNERAIATQQTGFWIICQSRSWVPDDLKGILWFGTDDAATSSLTPIYTSINRVPECIKVGNGDMMTYSPTSMFWITNRIAQFAYLLYDRLQPEIRTRIDEFENSCLAAIPGVDAKAAELLGERPTPKSRKAAIDYITDYSVSTAQKLFSIWQELDSYLLVKYIDGNIKIQNPDGSFKNNGYSTKIPAFPAQPGYSEKWRENTARDNGLILRVKQE